MNRITAALSAAAFLAASGVMATSSPATAAPAAATAVKCGYNIQVVTYTTASWTHRIDARAWNDSKPAACRAKVVSYYVRKGSSTIYRVYSAANSTSRFATPASGKVMGYGGTAYGGYTRMVMSSAAVKGLKHLKSEFSVYNNGSLVKKCTLTYSRRASCGQ
ncbi:hypothetical protein OIE66_12125 [Nonomuraea sp. NBC_01738]|uniref:hypothetical protein n=1 Tax=Nonomuraea sp. NBC_01738 TaxID=2976003 RepID=UPI002E12C56D|nr:hypothetical protein OIE66_12125 [Nonomuraea sp. NBC_01738]